MNNVSKKIIGSLLIASVFSISSKEEENTEQYDFEAKQSNQENFKIHEKGNIIKNLVQFKGDNLYRLIARHRSHYSHRSGGSRCSRIIIPSEAILGDRILSEGMYGTDVEMLVSLLKNKNLIEDNNIEKEKGYSVYNKYLTSTIKLFQLNENIPSTGLCDKNTLKRLL